MLSAARFPTAALGRSCSALSHEPLCRRVYVWASMPSRGMLRLSKAMFSAWSSWSTATRLLSHVNPVPSVGLMTPGCQLNWPLLPSPGATCRLRPPPTRCAQTIVGRSCKVKVLAGSRADWLDQVDSGSHAPYCGVGPRSEQFPGRLPIFGSHNGCPLLRVHYNRRRIHSLLSSLSVGCTSRSIDDMKPRRSTPWRALRKILERHRGSE
jgi:hypothetical protein